MRLRRLGAARRSRRALRPQCGRRGLPDYEMLADRPGAAARPDARAIPRHAAGRATRLALGNLQRVRRGGDWGQSSQPLALLRAAVRVAGGGGARTFRVLRACVERPDGAVPAQQYLAEPQRLLQCVQGPARERMALAVGVTAEDAAIVARVTADSPPARPYFASSWNRPAAGFGSLAERHRPGACVSGWLPAGGLVHPDLALETVTEAQQDIMARRYFHLPSTPVVPVTVGRWARRPAPVTVQPVAVNAGPVAGGLSCQTRPSPSQSTKTARRVSKSMPCSFESTN